MDAVLLLGGGCVAGGLSCGLISSRLHCWLLALDARARAQQASSQSFVRFGARPALLALERPMAWLNYLSRNGIDAFSPLRGLLLRSGRLRRRLDDAAGMLGRAGLSATSEGVCDVLALAAGMLFGLALVVSGSLFFASCLLVFAIVLLHAAMSRRKDADMHAMRELVPDALRCMEACFHAGLSVPQAFAEVARETRPPLSEAFSSVQHDMELGRSVEEALDRFQGRSGLSELAFVAMALDVQHACGGDASQIVRNAQESVEASCELRRSLRVQTAQAKLSAQVVSIMPVALLVVLSAIDPGFMAPFFESVEGLALLGLAVAMEAAGVFIVSRMLDVVVD